MKHFLFGIFLLPTISHAVPVAKTAPLKLCMNNSTGVILAKKSCSKKESAFTGATLHGYAGVGPQGPQGVTGAVGAPGPRGISSFDPLPAGVSIKGRLFRQVSQTSDFFEIESVNAEMSARAGKVLTNQDLVLQLNSAVLNACPNLSNCIDTDTLNNSFAKSGLCTGSPQLPTAPPGLICVYPFTFSNISNFFLEGGSANNFSASWLFDGQHDLGRTYLDATWAYTESLTSSALSPRTLKHDEYAPRTPLKK